MAIILRVNHDTYTGENGETHVGYGLSGFRNGTEPLFRLEDLSTDEQKILELIELLRDDAVAADEFEEMFADSLF